MKIIDNQQDQNKQYNWIPYLFVVFFGIIFLVDIFFIYIAGKTWRGVVTENGYQKGLNYNQTIEYVKKQQSLGWEVRVNYDKLKEKKGILNVVIFDKEKKVIDNAELFVNFTRPTQEGFDFNLELKFDKKYNSYISEVSFPFKGQWDAEIQVIKGSDVYQKIKRLIIY